MAALNSIRPTGEDELADIIADAAGEGAALAIAGGGSKAGVGKPGSARSIDMTGFVGIVDYDPAELVLTVRPGTALADVEALIAGENQMLGFEPFDHGPVFGTPPGRATIGGVVATGTAGSQRLSGGSARDHLLGFRAVSGRAEAFAAGAKVVKNVTGFDLSKLAAGSWGRLFAMTELTLKVLPRPQMRETWVIRGLEPERAAAAMATALRSRAEVAASAHVPAALNGGSSVTACRIQGFAPSVRARGAMLSKLLAPFGCAEPLGSDANSFWNDLATLRPLGGDRPLWRVTVPPSAGAAMAIAAERIGANWLSDWAGGLIWIAGGDRGAIRNAAERLGGHAMLFRAPLPMRAGVPAFHPPAPAIAALEERIRRAFDPHSVFEIGRF